MWAILAGLGSGALVALIGALAARRKTSAEATQLITDAAGSVVTLMEARFASMSLEISELRGRVSSLENEASRLRKLLSQAAMFIERTTAALRRNGIEPPVPPADLARELERWRWQHSPDSGEVPRSVVHKS